MKMKKFSLIMIMLLLTIGVAFASITAQDNMNLRNFYSIYDVLSMNLVGNITSPKYCIGTDCITSWSYENSSWNESYANTLYAPISEPIASSLGNWSADKSSYNTTSQLNTLYLNRSSEGLYTTTYNSTYDAKVTDNSSWNEIHANTLYMPINATTGNVSWNQSYANTLYAPISEPIASSLGNWSADKSGYYQNTGGTINGNVNINGNLTIIGAYINATVTNQYLNGSFLPSLNSTFNLGSTNQYWNNLYANNMYNKTTIDFMLLSYAPISEPIASGLGNWSADKSSYNTTIQLNTLYLNRSSEGLYTTTYNSTYDAKVTDNSSWNESYANTLYMPINATTGNSSWNESYANTLYALISEPIAASLGNWSAEKLNYNTTSELNSLYMPINATVTGNSSWNESYANTLYLNRSSEGLYTTTYNSTYDAKVTDNSSWNESYADTKYVPYNGAIGSVDLNGQLISNVETISFDGWEGNGSTQLTPASGDIMIDLPSSSGTLALTSDLINNYATILYVNNTNSSMKTYIDTTNSSMKIYVDTELSNNNASWLSTYNVSYDVKVTDNQSWNESYANTLYLNRSSEGLYTTTYNSTYDAKVSDNSSWNETYANTLYAPISEPIASSLGNWSADKSSYNTTAQLNTIYINSNTRIT